MSREGASLWSSASGSTPPSAEQAVRITSIGCVLAGMDSSTACTAFGIPRSPASFCL
jgi:hypothetical protein